MPAMAGIFRSWRGSRSTGSSSLRWWAPSMGSCSPPCSLRSEATARRTAFSPCSWQRSPSTSRRPSTTRRGSFARSRTSSACRTRRRGSSVRSCTCTRARQATGRGDSRRARSRTSYPWKDSDLTLAGLAERLGSTPHKLSEVLNAQIGQTFYDFVNGYRVREVQRRIASGDAARLKMLSLAFDAGFSSKSTFNQAFKKHTGATPSAFRERVGGGDVVESAVTP